SRVLNWASVATEIIKRTEETHKGLTQGRDLMRHMVRLQIESPAILNPYKQAKTQIATRVKALSAGNPDEKSPESAAACRLFMLLAEGIEKQRLVDFRNPEDPTLTDTEGLDAAAYQMAELECGWRPKDYAAGRTSPLSLS